MHKHPMKKYLISLQPCEWSLHTLGILLQAISVAQDMSYLSRPMWPASPAKSWAQAHRRAQIEEGYCRRVHCLHVFRRQYLRYWQRPTYGIAVSIYIHTMCMQLQVAKIGCYKFRSPQVVGSSFHGRQMHYMLKHFDHCAAEFAACNLGNLQLHTLIIVIAITMVPKFTHASWPSYPSSDPDLRMSVEHGVMCA